MMTKLLYSAFIALVFISLACSQSNDADSVGPECEKILAEMKEAQAVHNADYSAKGKAFYSWKKYYDELHSDSYLDTDEPLINSVKKCEGDGGPGEDFCSGVLEKYNGILAKEKSAKEALTKAEEKSKESKNKYNLTLKEAADMNCIMAGN